MRSVTYGHLGNSHDSVIVGDSANNDGGLALMVLHLANKPGNGKGRPVGLGHEKTPHHDLIELGVCAASQELVKLKYSYM